MDDLFFFCWVWFIFFDSKKGKVILFQNEGYFHTRVAWLCLINFAQDLETFVVAKADVILVIEWDDGFVQFVDHIVHNMLNLVMFFERPYQLDVELV